MAYKKQNFEPHKKLPASMLDNIEEGIISLEKALAKQKVKKIVLFKDNENIVGGELVLGKGSIPIELVDMQVSE